MSEEMKFQEVEEQEAHAYTVVPTESPLLSETVLESTKTKKQLDRLEKVQRKTDMLSTAGCFTAGTVVLGIMYIFYMALVRDHSPDSFKPYSHTIDLLGILSRVSLYSIVLFLGLSFLAKYRRAKLVERELATGDLRNLHHAISSGSYIKEHNRSKMQALLEQVRSENSDLFTKQDLQSLNSKLASLLNPWAFAAIIEAEIPLHTAIVSALGYVGNSASLRMLKSISRKQRLTTKFPEFHQTLQLSIVRLEERLAEKDTRDTLLRASSPEQPTAELLRPASEQHGLGNDLLLRPVNDAEVKDETKQELGNQ